MFKLIVDKVKLNSDSESSYSRLGSYCALEERGIVAELICLLEQQHLEKFLLLFYRPSHAQNAAFRSLNLQNFSRRITLVCLANGVFCVVAAETYREEENHLVGITHKSSYACYLDLGFGNFILKLRELK